MILGLRKYLDNQYNLYSVSDGEPGDAANFNSSFVSREVDDTKSGKLDLTNAGSSSVTDAQKNIADEAEYSGRTLNGASGVPAWISNAIGAISDNIKQRIDALQNVTETNQTSISTNSGNIATNTSDIGLNTSDIADVRTTTGTADGDTDMGTFTGSTLTDNVSAKALFQELETAFESIPGPLTFKGSWNASTNTPTLVSSTGTSGDVYIVSVAGTTNLDGITDWEPTDWAVFDGVGGVWVKVDNSEANLGANKFLSNLTAPIAIPDGVSLLPANAGNVDVGSASKRINRVHANQYLVNVSGTTRGSILRSGMPSGDTAVHLEGQGSENVGISSDNDNTADANPTANVLIETGNKLAGTGDSGHIIRRTGTSVGGSRGKIKHQDGTEGTIGHVLTQVAADGSVEFAPAGGGGTGFRNFIETQDATFENENTVGTWITFEDTGGYVDGTGGSPATITIQTETAFPQVGARSLEIVKAATDATDEGLSVSTETIDSQFRGRDLQGSIELDFSDALYTSGDAELRAYDVTNGAELTVINGSIPNSQSRLDFGVIGLLETTQVVRLSIYWQSDSATASTYSCFIDDVKLGDEGYVQGVTFGSDWIDAGTLPVDAVTTAPTKGTIAVDTYRYRQDGPNLDIEINYRQSTAGTAGSGTYLYTLPNSFEWAADVPTSTTDLDDEPVPYFGPIYLSNGQGNTTFAGWIKPYDSSRFSIMLGAGVTDAGSGSTGTQNQQGSVDMAFSQTELNIRGTFSAPMAGLQSGANLPVRVGLEDGVLLNAYKSGGTSSANVAIPSWTAAEKDTTSSFNLTTGVYTVPQDGDYWVNFISSATTTGAHSAYIYKNGAQYRIHAGGESSGAGAAAVHGLVTDLVAGDTLDFRLNAARTFTTSNFTTSVSIYKIPSPIVNLNSTSRVAVISETQTSGTAGGTFTSGSRVTRILNTEDGEDLVDVNANQITFKKSGKYYVRISAPALGVDTHQAYLRDVTNSADAIVGTPSESTSASAVETRSIGAKPLVISANDVFQVEHECDTTRATFGLGNSGSFGPGEIYTIVEIWELN